MVDSINVKNFKSFEDISVEGLRRINVLVGDNGSGKTALLEAIFLASGVSPEVINRIRFWRSGENFNSIGFIGTPDELSHALWAELFFKFNVRKPALISMRGRVSHSRSVTITFSPHGRKNLIPPSRNSPGSQPRIERVAEPIEFKWKIEGYPDVKISPSVQNGSVVIPPSTEGALNAAFFAANQTPSSMEAAMRFSRLSKTFKEKDFIKSFSILFPKIKNISIEFVTGTSTLFAEVDGLEEKIPLSLASGGVNKLVAILLAISQSENGIIVIDEIENGFYYKKMPLIWKTILEYARIANCQIFASTHSQECLVAAAQLAEENPDDFCLLRTVAGENGAKVRYFAGNKFASAVLDNVEIR